MFIAIQQVSRLAGNHWNARTFLCQARVCTPPTDPDPGRLFLIPGRRSRVRSAACAAHVRLPRRLYSRCSPPGALILSDSWQDCPKPLLFSTLLYFIPNSVAPYSHPLSLFYVFHCILLHSIALLLDRRRDLPSPTRPQCLSMFYQCLISAFHSAPITRLLPFIYTQACRRADIFADTRPQPALTRFAPRPEMSNPRPTAEPRGDVQFPGGSWKLALT